MIKLIAIAVLGASLAGCVTSPLTPAPIFRMSSPGGVPARPASEPQDPGKCIHDEGYSRWTDCGSEMTPGASQPVMRARMSGPEQAS
jgi:hypothetical protein